jgi:hypothetical protein
MTALFALRRLLRGVPAWVQARIDVGGRWARETGDE